MSFRRYLTALSVFSIILSPALPANAIILTFEGLNLNDFDDIPGTYGDNVTSINDGVGNYLEGNGFTPNISVEYRTVDPSDGTTVENNLDYFEEGFGDLTDVAYPVDNGTLGEISLVPESGYSVILNSFDLADYLDIGDQTVRVLDQDFNILVDYSPFDVSTESNTFTPNINSAEPIRIQFGPSWDTGIDNINFDQTNSEAVPFEAEGTMGLVAIGGYLGYRRLRKRKQTSIQNAES